MTRRRQARALAIDGSAAWRIAAVTVSWILLNLYAMRPVFAAANHAGVTAAAWSLAFLVALLPIVAFFVSRNERAPFRESLQRLGYIALGVSSLLIVFVFASDIVRLAFLATAGVVRRP
jgi:hypothetical protein